MNIQDVRPGMRLRFRNDLTREEIVEAIRVTTSFVERNEWGPGMARAFECGGISVACTRHGWVYDEELDCAWPPDVFEEDVPSLRMDVRPSRVGNRRCGQFIASCLPFRGSNLYGRAVGSDDAYGVFSYGEHWPLAVFAAGLWLVNTDRRSVSTRNHLGIVRRAIPANRVEVVGVDVLRRIVEAEGPTRTGSVGTFVRACIERAIIAHSEQAGQEEPEDVMEVNLLAPEAPPLPVVFEEVATHAASALVGQLRVSAPRAGRWEFYARSTNGPDSYRFIAETVAAVDAAEEDDPLYPF